jgi:hypothetical protein
MAVGQPIYITTGGLYTVVSKGSSTTATIRNSGANGNASPGATVANASEISPAGVALAISTPVSIANGGTGQTNATNAFNALSPLTTNGDTLVREGGSNTRKPIGTNLQIPVSNGTVWNWGTNAPVATNITGILPVANGGTAASTAAGARTNLAVPGLATDNTYTGSNSYNVATAPGKVFKVYSGGNTYILVDEVNGLYLLGDSLGNTTVDFGLSILVGAWVQPKKGGTEATGATYTITDEETIVSRRSLTGVQTINLPTGVADRVVRIVDGDGNAFNNNITIARASADTIMGATSAIISLNYGTMALRFIAATSNWVPCP